MAVNLSRSSALLRAIDSAPPVAVPRLSPIAIRGGRKVVQLCSGKLRSGSLKSSFRYHAMVGEAAEEIKEDDGVSIDDSADDSSENEQVNFLFLIFFFVFSWGVLTEEMKNEIRCTLVIYL